MNTRPPWWSPEPTEVDRVGRPPVGPIELPGYPPVATTTYSAIRCESCGRRRLAEHGIVKRACTHGRPTP